PIMRNILPVEAPNFLPDFDTLNLFPRIPPKGPILKKSKLQLKDYPPTWATPPVDGPDIEKVLESIDWEYVPNIPVRNSTSSGDLDMSKYDVLVDDSCWWSATGCVEPKLDYLPVDIYECPAPGHFGLTYDDGPMVPNKSEDSSSDSWEEPDLYKFLNENDQKATLFYVGSNVALYPDIAKRAIDSGHDICLHTWSHPPMTTRTNEQIVAELYWNLRAIKEATGITSKCWRPPYGDVDDRVRGIAHQMGLRTVLWTRDSQDWQLDSPGSTLTPKDVDGYFEQWIADQVAGKNNDNGHIGLQHELSDTTVRVAMKWLPRMQEAFNVTTVHQCLKMEKPYWES
ncbi:carbohydrate esterase family 4 protein, partial [Phycomyces blakesleeanus NRRL 1555(-)]